MAATFEQISGWFDQGVEMGASHMLVVCDTFDYGDYPVYVGDQSHAKVMMHHATASEVVTEFSKDMQKVMEVYDLRMDKQHQMVEHRAWHVADEVEQKAIFNHDKAH